MCGRDFPPRAIRQSIHTTSKSGSGECEKKNKAHHRERETQDFYVKTQIKKNSH